MTDEKTEVQHKEFNQCTQAALRIQTKSALAIKSTVWMKQEAEGKPSHMGELGWDGVHQPCKCSRPQYIMLPVTREQGRRMVATQAPTTWTAKHEADPRLRGPRT